MREWTKAEKREARSTEAECERPLKLQPLSAEEYCETTLSIVYATFELNHEKKIHLDLMSSNL